MTLSDNSKSELLWWITNITGSHRSLIQSNPDLVLTTDASLLGWGAVMNEKEIGGQWSSIETKLNQILIRNKINYLEMKAVLLGWQPLCSDVHDIHVCIQSDNTTAVSYINSMGSVKSENCNDMACQIWEWCISILLSGRYQQKCFSLFLFNAAPLILTCLHHDLTIK